MAPPSLRFAAFLNNSNVGNIANAQKTPFTLAGLEPGSDEDMFTKVRNHLSDNWPTAPSASPSMLAPTIWRCICRAAFCRAILSRSSLPQRARAASSSAIPHHPAGRAGSHDKMGQELVHTGGDRIAF